MDSFAKIRAQFPVTENNVYLNNAAVAPVPLFVAREAAGVYEGYGASGGNLEGRWHRRIAEIREHLAAFIGAAADEIFFTKNTSEGLLVAIQGFRWRPGDVVVTLRGEFPAVTVPLELLAARGVSLRYVNPRPDGTFYPDDVSAALDESVRMLVVSFVEYHTGLCNDLAALGSLCRERGVFLAVDGVQGVGALRTAVRDWGVDLFSAGAHKWLLSGEGIGFCYLRAESLEALQPVNCSWLSVEDPLDFLVRGLQEPARNKPLRNEASRFEGGTLNVPGIFTLGRSIETMLELGAENIERYILSLGARAVEGLRQKGYLVISPQEEGRRSGITCFSSPETDNRELLLELRRKGFTLGFPCGALRISPHYYNNNEDIDRLIEALP